MVWRNRWILETQPSVWTNPKLSMLKTYGLHFLWHCSTFLELRSFNPGLSFKFSPSVAFSGPYWLMLQEFLFFFFFFPQLLQEFLNSSSTATEHAVIRVIVWSPVLTMLHFSLKSDVRGCLQSGPSLHPLLFSTMLWAVWALIILWLPVAFLPLLSLTHHALWQEYNFFLSNHPFKTISVLLGPAQEPWCFLDYSGWKWALFPMCASACTLVISAGT